MSTNKNYKTLIVESTEEEIGKELFIIRYPEEYSIEKVKEILDMGSRYAAPGFSWDDEDDGNYDQYFSEMQEWREDTNGQETFFAYLEKFGILSECLKPDFKFEW